MTGTFQLISHSQIAALESIGWRVVDALADCHHGAHAVLMQAPENSEPEKPEEMGE
jgi:hypothetical protein